MKKMKFLLSGFLSLILVSQAWCQDPGWTVNPGAFNYSMTVTSVANVACVELSNNSSKIGAFVGTDCRGVVNTNTNANGRKLAFLIVYSNSTSGERVKFKIYDAVSNTVFDAKDSLVFSNNATHGTVSVPYQINSNHPPTDISISNVSINENMAIGSVVGLMSSVNQDPSYSPIYTLSGAGPDNSSFQITGNQLKNAVIFNYEQQTSQSITLKVDDQGGCSYSESFVIQILDAVEQSLPLPSTNFISPNADGKNDYWKIDNIDLYHKFHLSIFNENGQRVYDVPEGYNNEFDGMFNGKALPNGIYYYHLASTTNSVVFKGIISILK
jgi:gliding motility-associated-like protein